MEKLPLINHFLVIVIMSYTTLHVLEGVDCFSHVYFCAFQLMQSSGPYEVCGI
jgi:hypothetical protein